MLSRATRTSFTAAQAAVTLALCLGLQPATTDLYLPALPLLTRELGTTVATAQLTMSVLILAFGLAQLVWGPLADRHGRRPVLQAGIALYVLAVLAGGAAPHIGLLIVARGAQGAALAAMVVVARAMVRDLYAPAEGTRVMSWAMSGLGLIAIASPLLGGWVTAAWGWRAPFGVVALMALTLAGWVWIRVPETIPQLNPDALSPGPLLATWRRILGNRNFLAWTCLTGATYAGLFLYLAGSPFVYINVLGLSPSVFGLALCSSSVAYLAGTFMCRRWLLRHGAVGAVQRAGFWTLAGGLGLAALAAAGVQTVWAVLLPQLAYAFAHGTHQSCGQAGTVSHFPRDAGVASALAGFLLALVAFVVGNLLGLGLSLDHSTRPLAYGIGLASLLTSTVAWTLVRRHGQAAG